VAVRIGVIGAGTMSGKYHCPSLVALRRPKVTLEAICDLDEAKAKKHARRFGFKHVYTSMSEMFATARLDGVCVFTPINATAPVATEVMRAGLPVYMEKPPGATLLEANGLARTAEKMGVPSMVAFNRRYVPALVEAKRRAEELGPVTYVEAVQLRSQRLEPRFVRGTALHVIDAVRHLAGDVVRVKSEKRRSPREKTNIWMATLDFASGAIGRILIKPHAGCNVERYVLSSPDYTVFAAGGLDWLADYPGLLEVHVGGKKIRSKIPAKRVKVDDHVYWCGFYSEMAEFVAALSEGRAPRPSVAEAVQSVKLAAMIDTGKSGTL